MVHNRSLRRIRWKHTGCVGGEGMAEKIPAAKKPHRLFLDERERFTLTGVSDVRDFDEKAVTAVTDQGELCICGSDLQITRLDLESGDLALEGHVDSMTYSEGRAKSGGWLRRLFR